MTNQQLYLSIGIPTFTVILAILISLWQNNRLSDKMDRLFEQHRAEFRADLNQHRAEFRADMSQFRSEVQAEMNLFRSEVRGDLKEFRADMIAFRREIHGDIVPLHERVKAVEVRVDTQ